MQARVRELVARGRASLVVQAIVMLAIYAAIWREVRETTTLGLTAYAEPVMLVQIPEHPRLAVLTAALLVPVAAGFNRLRWDDLDPRRRTRWFVFAVALILGWAFSTYDYNLFFDQAHTVDRLALLALTGLVLVHPGFAVAHVLLLLVILGQLMYPLPEAMWHWPDKRLPVDVLILFAAFLYTRLLTKARARIFLFGVLTLVAVTYVHAAVEKMRLGPHFWSWPLDNDTRNIFVAAHVAGGWLRGVADETILSIATGLGWLSIPMGVGTILLELAPLALLAKPVVTRWLPLSLIALHAMIYATTGIFFWKWMLMHLALMWFARRLTEDLAEEEHEALDGEALEEEDLDEEEQEELAGDEERELAAHDEAPVEIGERAWCGGIYRWPMVALFVLFVISSRWILHNVPFAWVDSRVSNFFVLRGETATGKAYRIDPRFFGPYDLTMNQSRHYYAVGAPVLVDTYGTTHSWDLARALQGAAPGDLDAIRAKFARMQLNPQFAQQLGFFMHQSLRNANKRGHRDFWLHALAPPYHFQTTVPEGAYDLQEPLVAVTLTFEEWFYDGSSVTKTREIPAGRIPLQ